MIEDCQSLVAYSGRVDSAAPHPHPGRPRDTASDDATTTLPDDAQQQARLRALSSPVRLRLLRLCAFDARTNKELADLLDMNPGTTLHHVRTLVSTGLLRAEAERPGRNGAREVPYRATGMSWTTQVPGGSYVMVQTFLDQLRALDGEDFWTTWLGLRLNDEHRTEFMDRLFDLADEFRRRGPDPDGTSYSLFAAFHPDLNPPAASDPSS